MIKKISFLIVTAVLMSPVVVCAQASAAVIREDLDWIEVEGILEGRVKFDAATGEIVAVEESVTVAHIPFEINGAAVKAIGPSAFGWCTNLTSLSLPNTIEVIGERAFQACVNLVNINIPEGIHSVNAAAFFLCENLQSISIPSSLSFVGPDLFAGCEKLATVYYGGDSNGWNAMRISIPENTIVNLAETWISVPGIEGGLVKFDRNKGTITEVEKTVRVANIPSAIDGIAVIEIASEAFYDCNNLRAAYLPNTVNSIPDGLFENCSSLALVYIPDSVQYIGQKAFWGCVSLKNIDLPDELLELGDRAFFGCDNITRINIPEKVEKLGTLLFGGCDNLDTIVIKGNVSEIAPDAFSYCNKLEMIYYNGSYVYWDSLQINVAANIEVICNADVTMPSLPYDKIAHINTKMDAISVLGNAIMQLSGEQRSDANSVDAVAQFAEAMIAHVASVYIAPYDNGILAINYDTLLEFEQTAIDLANDLFLFINNSGMMLTRKLEHEIRIYTKPNAIINIDPNVAMSKFDKLWISTGNLEVAIDLDKVVGEAAIEIATNVDDGYRISYTGGGTPLTVAITVPDEDFKYQTLSENGTIIGGKYNPATNKLEAKTTVDNGVYTVINNQKYFSDIDRTSAQMQESINFLAAKGIITGRDGTVINDTILNVFEPDAPISRAEVATMLVKVLYAYDSNANAWYDDVAEDDWYVAAAGSAHNIGIMIGEDNKFRGNDPITQEEFMSVVARVLKLDKDYIEVDNINKYLSEYADAASIVWAHEDIAFATREDLVMRYNSANFMPTATVTRGEAAVILKKLFDRLE